MPEYIYKDPQFPAFFWDNTEILKVLAKVLRTQGQLLGRMKNFGFGLQQETMLNAMTAEITKSNEIEGEILDYDSVRSSIVRQLGLNFGVKTGSTHHIDGIVQMMIDASNNYDEKLTDKRLFGWHAALFPAGFSGTNRISVAQYRKGPMLIVSGMMGDKVHYEAPGAENVPAMMKELLVWINAHANWDPLIKAAVSHLWFLTIHPFDDGNGRIARAITELFLARSESSSLRFYSMSRQIQAEKKQYYQALKSSQKGSCDITGWLVWFFGCLLRAMDNSGDLISFVIRKAEFWQSHSDKDINENQRKLINLLIDGFKGNMSSGKVAKICRVSQDTAARLLQDLADKGILLCEGAGRSTHYVLRGFSR